MQEIPALLNHFILEGANVMKEDIVKEIEALKNEKDAVLLVHNYQLPEIQDIADILGDSLDLSRRAKETEKSVIVFCGVKFMAETAKILSPHKRVFLPVYDAGCPMADMVTAEELIKFKEQNPDYWIVSYVNTNADVKAVSDVCCTSANAIKVVKNIPAKRILFVPDKNLGDYVKKNVPEKEIKVWNGYCIVHVRIDLEEVKKVKQMHPDALLIVHPECEPEVVELADEVLSTNGMIRFVKESKNKKFIIGTEEGLIYRLKNENPDKIFYAAGKAVVCANMKKTRLEDVLKALKYEQYEITLEHRIIEKAQIALNRMLEYL